MDHVHRLNDGRGRRRVYVDEVLIERVFYADVRKGLVRYYQWPLRVHKHSDRIATRTKLGVVRVEFI